VECSSDGLGRHRADPKIEDSRTRISEACHHLTVQSVVTVVEAEFARWAGAGVGEIERNVLGTDQPQEIAEIFEHFCAERLGSAASQGLFYAASSGCVLGVRLASGLDVVVKAHQDPWDRSFLDVVQRAQGVAAAGGLPCPHPLASPAPIVSGRSNLAVVESWLPDPGMRPGGSTDARLVSAGGLARQIAACRGLPNVDRLLHHPLRQPDDRLYGEPHSPIFDFHSTAPGAEWIDELAAEARRIRDRDDGDLVVAHTDWSARNVRFDEERLLAVYDWDSLAQVTESTAVGQAAMTWSVTADPGGTEFPTEESVLGYIDDYLRTRTRPFSSKQDRSARAAATYVLAYTARCEHSLAVNGVARADQCAARDRLADIGASLLVA
jgi:hypothetical protein